MWLCTTLDQMSFFRYETVNSPLYLYIYPFDEFYLMNLTIYCNLTSLTFDICHINVWFGSKYLHINSPDYVYRKNVSAIYCFLKAKVQNQCKTHFIIQNRASKSKQKLRASRKASHNVTAMRKQIQRSSCICNLIEAISQSSKLIGYFVIIFSLLKNVSSLFI